MSKKIYRVLDENSGAYISKVAGFLRSEEYNKVDSAYVYNKQQATQIVRLMNETRDKMLNGDSDIPEKLEESLRNQTLAIIEIELEDVKLSLEEIAMALESAKAKNISKEQAFRNAQWERIRRYMTKVPQVTNISICMISFRRCFLMKGPILNPTKKLLRRANRKIEEIYNPRKKQALFVFTTNLDGYHLTYKMSLDTFAALGTAISPVMISEIPAKDIDSKEYILFLFAIYNKWNKLPMVFRGYTPEQVKWFMKKFGNRIYNEKSTVDWWRNTY